MITFRQKGDFSKLTRYLERAKEVVKLGDLDKYGREGVAALASATPVDSGKTASSWRYEIISILLSSLFLTKSQMKHGGRLRSYEQDR